MGRKNAKWRKRMGIEPTPRTGTARGNGFEDRESHQAPSASSDESTTRTATDAPRATGLAALAASVPVRVALLALLVAAAYSGALSAGVAWDDAYLVSANPAIRTLEHPGRFFTDSSTISPTGGEGLSQYRPLRTLAYAVQFAVFGGNAWGFHLVSILLHIVAGWLVGSLTTLLFGRGGWLAAAIWLLHPIVSENVLYLAAQGNLLCLDLAVLAMVCHLRWLQGGSRWLRAAAIGATFAAMTAYEFGAVLPALLVILDAVWLWQGHSSSVPVLRRHAPYWLALGAFLALRAGVAAPIPRHPSWEGSWTAALMHQLGLWLEAWRLTFLPIFQKVRYFPSDVPAWAPPPVAILAHLALAGVVIRAALTGAWRLAAACIVWWYVAQAPTSNIIVTNLGFMFAPRFLFLALILPVAAVSAWLAARDRGRWMIAAAVVAAVAATALIRQQTAIWQSPITLNRAIVEANPDDFGGQYTLGWTYFIGGETGRARQQLAIARSIAPDFALTYLVLGEIELRAGDLVRAHTMYRKFLELQPTAVESKLRLAEIATAVGQREAAQGWLAMIGALDQLDPCARARAELALARIEAALGDREAVAPRVERALASWTGTADVLYQSGMLLAHTGQRERGRDLLRRAAEQISRDYSDRVGDYAWLNLAALTPLLPLTPEAGFGSVSVPEVGP